MKKTIFLIIIISVIATGAVFAQTYFEYDEISTSFQEFADAVAPILPFNAAIGLNWSDAYIGQFLAVPPHFGFGVSAGVTTIPITSMNKVLDAFSITLPAELSFINDYGFPFPAYTADLRIGGFILPFDVGLKFGYLPKELVKDLPVNIDYLFVGADLRYAVLKEHLLIPAVSIGVGYSFLKGGVGVPGLLGGDITLSSFEVPNTSGGKDTHNISLTDPSLSFNWQTQIIDFKAQVSKSLLIITPYAGLGASYGISNAGGGLTTKLLLDGTEITDDQITEINDAFTAAGETPPDLSAQGIIVSKDVQGFSVRAYGGLSLNLLILKLDFTAMYNFTGGSYGGTVNLRFQL